MTGSHPVKQTHNQYLPSTTSKFIQILLDTINLTNY